MFVAQTVRKKFLRQNRDIARVNSAQSLRIRSLEGECGRLLSDNLTLNGRILELERDLEESREAQRIADHALEIKAKMEAQLREWSAMLGGLGVERAAKRHAPSSPGGTTVARGRVSMNRSPAAKQRPRDSRSSAEMAALQEGKLPPIQENTTYPRRTMKYAMSSLGIFEANRMLTFSQSQRNTGNLLGGREFERFARPRATAYFALRRRTSQS